MRENSAWSLLTLAVGFMLAILGLSTDWLWLQPYLLGAAALCLVASIVCFGWPLRKKDNRTRCAEFCKHPFRAAKMIQPFHIVVLGLVIAISGAIWQWKRNSAVDPIIADLQDQIKKLTADLTAFTAPKSPTTRLAQVRADEDIVKRRYSEEELAEMIAALRRMSAAVDKKIAPGNSLLNENLHLWQQKLTLANAQNKAAEIEKARALVIEGYHDILETLKDKKDFNDQLQAVIPKNPDVLSSMDSELKRASGVLRDLSKHPDINIVEYARLPMDRVQGLNAGLRDWIPKAQASIAAKMEELRTWKNP